MTNLLKNNIERFVTLTNEEFLEVKNFFQSNQYNKGDFIIKENDSVKDIYFILSGLVSLSYSDDDAKEHIISFAMEDWWETDFSAFYNESKANLRLKCIENTEVHSLSFSNYKKLCTSFPKLVNYFLDKSIRGHIANQKRILSLLTLNPKDRYTQFIHLYPSLIQRLPKSILASYLGVSRETLSRLYQNSKNKK